MPNIPTDAQAIFLPRSAMLGRIRHCMRQAKGHAILVGGAVRDMLLGRQPKDFDIEVFGLDAAGLTAALQTLGAVTPMGRAFAVWQVRGLNADFSLPRAASFAEAVQYRDLTINSMGLCLDSGALVDPLAGQADLKAGVLRACDARYFGQDPLRGLRVAQLMACYDMRPDAALTALCQTLCLDLVAPERIFVAFNKLLLGAPAPSAGLKWLAHAGLLRHFASLDAMRGVRQDPKWHPEGDVFVHTCMVVDCAAKLRDGGPDDLALMWAALLHDIGKPISTFEQEGRLRSPNHDVAGVAPAQALLTGLKAPHALIKQVTTLIRHHLAPAMLHAAQASDRAYRRLARHLHASHVSPHLLARLARADQLGRTTAEARAGRSPATDGFAARMAALGLATTRPPDVVQGRDLMRAGFRPGPAFAGLLEACRQVQDETGSSDAAFILNKVILDAPRR